MKQYRAYSHVKVILRTFESFVSCERHSQVMKKIVYNGGFLRIDSVIQKNSDLSSSLESHKHNVPDFIGCNRKDWKLCMVAYFAASTLTFKNPYFDAIPAIIFSSYLMGNIDSIDTEDARTLLMELIKAITESFESLPHYKYDLIPDIDLTE